ncbi:MAG: hypothetical protein AAFQ64_20290 [Pseudomonadota bacterium]
MDTIFQTLNDPRFAQIFLGIGFTAFALSLGMIACGFAFYGRTQEVAKVEADTCWVLLFASWRDSLIITLLFMAEGFLFDFSALQGASQLFPAHILLYAPVVQPVLSLIIHVCIAVVASLRIIAISRWLRLHARSDI